MSVFDRLLRISPVLLAACLTFASTQTVALAQQAPDELRFETATAPVEISKDTVSTVFHGVIRGYQTFVGPYYPSQCPFYPSCSNYGLQAVSNHGPLWGTLMTFDRLSRCHSNRDTYPIALEIRSHGRPAFWDPPSNDFLFTDSYLLDKTFFIETVPKFPDMDTFELKVNVAAADKEIVKYFSFASQLIDEKRYAEAELEFKRIAFLFPNDPSSEDAEFLEAHMKMARKDWKGAADAMFGFAADHPESNLSNEALFRAAYSAMKTRDFKFATETAACVTNKASSPEADKADAMYFKYLIAVESLDSKSAIAEKKAMNELGASMGISDSELLELSDLPYRSETLGSVLSAVVPGSGQLYAGRSKDALYSFIVVGLFSWGAYELYDNDSETAAVVMGSFAAVFYGANVYGGARAVKQYNGELAQRRIKEIEKKSQTSSRFWMFVSQEMTGNIGVTIEF